MLQMSDDTQELGFGQCENSGKTTNEGGNSCPDQTPATCTTSGTGDTRQGSFSTSSESVTPSSSIYNADFIPFISVDVNGQEKGRRRHEPPPPSGMGIRTGSADGRQKHGGAGLSGQDTRKNSQHLSSGSAAGRDRQDGCDRFARGGSGATGSRQRQTNLQDGHHLDYPYGRHHGADNSKTPLLLGQGVHGQGHNDASEDELVQKVKTQPQQPPPSISALHRNIGNVWPPNATFPRRVSEKGTPFHKAQYKVGDTPFSAVMLWRCTSQLARLPQEERDKIRWDMDKGAFYSVEEEEADLIDPRKVEKKSAKEAEAEGHSNKKDHESARGRKRTRRSKKGKSSKRHKRKHRKNDSSPESSSSSSSGSSSSGSSSSSESDAARAKGLTAAQCLARAFNPVVKAREEDKVERSVSEILDDLNFFPRIPAVKGESPEDTAARLAKALLVLKKKERYDRYGNPKSEIGEFLDPETFLQELVEHHEESRNGLASSASSTPVSEMVDNIHDGLAENSSSLMKFMTLKKYPARSRALVSSACHELTRVVQKQEQVISAEILLAIVALLLKKGQLGVVQGSKGGPPSGSGTKQGGKVHKFIFSPEKFPNQKRPEGDEWRICFDCCNKLFEMGKLAEGDNPPSSVWFRGFPKLNKHKKTKECLGKQK